MPPESSHGAGTRRPVVYGGRKIPNLTVRTLDDGTNVYEVRLRMPDGTQPRVKLDATTAGEAVRERNGLLVDRDRGLEHQNSNLNPTIAEVLDEWLADLRARVGIRDEKRRVAASTYADHETMARRYFRPAPLGPRRVADLQTADIRKLLGRLQARGLAPNTVSNVLKTLSGALEFALENDYVPRNVMRDLPVRLRPGCKRVTEPRYLTYAEVLTLLDAAVSSHPRASLPLRPILACCFYAALRIGETLGLQWECIDFRADLIDVRQQAPTTGGELVPHTKTKASMATVDLVPELKRELLTHRLQMAEVSLQRVRPEAMVFVGTRGQMLRHASTQTALYNAAARAGLNQPGLPPIGHHDLRHSAAALALQHGASPPEAAEMLRHANAGVTMRSYAGVNADGRGAAFRKLRDAGIGG